MAIEADAKDGAVDEPTGGKEAGEEGSREGYRRLCSAVAGPNGVLLLTFDRGLVARLGAAYVTESKEKLRFLQEELSGGLLQDFDSELLAPIVRTCRITTHARGEEANTRHWTVHNALLRPCVLFCPFFLSSWLQLTTGNSRLH